MKLTKSIWEGVELLVDGYLKPTPLDHVLIVYTSETYEEACWVAVALQMRHIPSSRAWTIPLRDPGFAERLAQAVPDPGSVSGCLILLSLERETLSHDAEIRSALLQFPPKNAKVFRAISASGLLFSHGMTATPEQLTKINVALLNRLMPASEIRITSAAGTDLKIKFDSRRYRWVSNRGTWTPGKFAILPAGEVATYPSSVDGVFIADFGFNLNVTTKQDARLNHAPVNVVLENGQAVQYSCGDPAVQRFLDECFELECSRRVGEVGFGTNFGIRTPVSVNSHLNERHPGLHLGFGESNQSPQVVGYQCGIHLDLIASGGIIWIDNDEVPIDLSNVQPSSLPHPVQTRDEDAFSSDGNDGFENDDCCSYVKCSIS